MATPSQLLSPQDFAARIRAKHPGAYDDIPDAELTQRVLSKFPEYGDMVQPAAGLAAAGPQPGFGARASEQFGLSQHPIDQLIGELQQLKAHPVSTLWESVKQPILGLRDLTYGLVTHPADTVAQVTGGKQFAQDVQSGNYRGALGTLAGSAAQVAMIKAASPAVGPATSAEEASARALPAAQAATDSTGRRAMLLGRNPQEAYESALKPSMTIPQADRAAMVQTGIREGLPVTPNGIAKLSSLIEDLNSQIKEQIAKQPDKPISPGQAVQNLRSTEQKFATQVNPKADLDAIDAAKTEFVDQFRSTPGGAVRNMTADEAQAMKQGTYRVLGGKAYGEMGSASVEAQKALARGLKEEIAKAFPEINQLNAREGALLDLQPVLEKAVNRIGNHQMLGIGTPIAAGAAKAVTGSGTVAAVTGLLKAVLDDPGVKSRLAIRLGRAGVAPAQIGTRLNAYSAALAEASQRESSAYPESSPSQ